MAYYQQPSFPTSFYGSYNPSTWIPAAPDAADPEDLKLIAQFEIEEAKKKAEVSRSFLESAKDATEEDRRAIAQIALLEERQRVSQQQKTPSIVFNTMSNTITNNPYDSYKQDRERQLKEQQERIMREQKEREQKERERQERERQERERQERERQAREAEAKRKEMEKRATEVKLLESLNRCLDEKTQLEEDLKITDARITQLTQQLASLN